MPPALSSHRGLDLCVDFSLNLNVPPFSSNSGASPAIVMSEGAGILSDAGRRFDAFREGSGGPAAPAPRPAPVPPASSSLLEKRPRSAPTLPMRGPNIENGDVGVVGVAEENRFRRHQRAIT